MHEAMWTPDSLNLTALPSVALSQRQTLPALAACYFVVGHEGTVLYIGRTGNLQRRFLAHHRQWYFEQEPPPVRIAWLLMTDTRLLRQIERLCIDHWTPKYNQWQARQAQDQQGFVTLSIRFSPEDLKAIDREVARHQAVQPGIDFNRSGIIRMLVLQALRAPAKEL